MDVKYINPFLSAIEKVLTELGAKWIKKGKIRVKKDMTIDKDVTTFVGIVGSVCGNVSYSFSSKTAIGLVSLLMEMEIDIIDEIARSAIGELSNMVTGNALSILASRGETIEITTPIVVMGEDMYFVLGSVDTIMVDIETQFGFIEVNFGLEV
jgi:chemotaxis protein CheX